MRVAGHQRVDVLRAPGRRSARRSSSIASIEPLGRGARVEPQIGRDLIVAAARGVQPAAGVADLVDQPRLDVHVDVLERFVPRQLAARELLLDAPQPVDDRRRRRPREIRPCAREHLARARSSRRRRAAAAGDRTRPTR